MASVSVGSIGVDGKSFSFLFFLFFLSFDQLEGSKVGIDFHLSLFFVPLTSFMPVLVLSSALVSDPESVSESASLLELDYLFIGFGVYYILLSSS